MRALATLIVAHCLSLWSPRGSSRYRTFTIARLDMLYRWILPMAVRFPLQAKYRRVTPRSVITVDVKKPDLTGIIQEGILYIVHAVTCGSVHPQLCKTISPSTRRHPPHCVSSPTMITATPSSHSSSPPAVQPITNSDPLRNPSISAPPNSSHSYPSSHLHPNSLQRGCWRADGWELGRLGRWR